MKIHELKIDIVHFEDTLNGSKTFDVRKNDRDFQKGDIVHLRETVFTGNEMEKGAELLYTGREAVGEILGVHSGFGLIEGWIIFSYFIWSYFESCGLNMVAR